MKVLELFAGSCSFSNVAATYGFETYTTDIKQFGDINNVSDIFDFDYKNLNLQPDIIWASPPCTTFSIASCGKHWTAPDENNLRYPKTNEAEIGLKILQKTIEIMHYLNPKYYFIENPQTGRMKEYIDKPFYDVDYCKYSNFGYKKRTRIWTNLKGFEPKTCKNDCGNLMENTNKHRVNFGGSKMVKDGDKIIKVKSAEQRQKYKDFENIQPYLKGKCGNRNERYRIPFKIIRSLFDVVVERNK